MDWPHYEEAEELTLDGAINRIAKRTGIPAANLWMGAEILLPDFEVLAQRGRGV